MKIRTQSKEGYNLSSSYFSHHNADYTADEITHESFEYVTAAGWLVNSASFLSYTGWIKTFYVQGVLFLIGIFEKVLRASKDGLF